MVFAHVKNLPDVFPAGFCDIRAVAFSAQPRPAAESYMPVFRVAQSYGEVVAASLGAKAFSLTHQHAHIAAALIANELEGELLALHVSGGTTDMLKVQVEQGIVRHIAHIGGTSDIAAGQLIDRIGVKLGLPFPAGGPLEAMAVGEPLLIKSSVKGLSVSFSGAETAAVRLLARGQSPQNVAAGVQKCVAKTLEKLLVNARAQTGIVPVLLFGGVMQNGYIRSHLQRRSVSLYFADKKYSPDNACGLAREAWRRFTKRMD